MSCHEFGLDEEALRPSYQNATDSNIWGAISAVGTSPAIKSGTAALGGMGISYGLTAPPSAATDLALIGGGAGRSIGGSLHRNTSRISYIESIQRENNSPRCRSRFIRRGSRALIIAIP